MERTYHQWISARPYCTTLKRTQLDVNLALENKSTNPITTCMLSTANHISSQSEMKKSC